MTTPTDPEILLIAITIIIIIFTLGLESTSYSPKFKIIAYCASLILIMGFTFWLFQVFPL